MRYGLSRSPRRRRIDGVAEDWTAHDWRRQWSDLLLECRHDTAAGRRASGISGRFATGFVLIAVVDASVVVESQSRLVSVSVSVYVYVADEFVPCAATYTFSSPSGHRRLLDDPHQQHPSRDRLHIGIHLRLGPDPSNSDRVPLPVL